MDGQITYAYILSSNSRNNTIVEQRLNNVSGAYTGEPDWQTSLIFESYDKSAPRRRCALHGGDVSDDRLWRSEVFCAAALIAAWLDFAKVTEDRIVPVDIYPADRLDANCA
jgi:hypothetical protein